MDKTHIIKENLEWWKHTFEAAGFRVKEARYHIDHIKENWASWEKGNGFFVLSTSDDSGDVIDFEKEWILSARAEEVWRMKYSFYRKWFELLLQNIGLKGYFEEKNYENVGIYGLGDIGQHLLELLQGEGVHVSQIIDRKEIHAKCIAYHKPENVEACDVIVITPMTDQENICRSLRKVGFSGELVHISDIIDDIHYKKLVMP